MLKTHNIDIHTKEEWEYVENFKEIIHDSIYQVLHFWDRNVETNVHVILCKY